MGITLSKGQSISLDKQGAGLKMVRMGLGWDAAKPKAGLLSALFGSKAAASIDLDASCLMFSRTKSLIGVVWFRQLHSQDNAVVHSGDNVTGDGDGDDEVITVDLNRLDEKVVHLVFTVNSFTGQTFNKVENASCRLVDAGTGSELAVFNLAEKGSHTGVIMAVLSRGSGGWTMKAIGSETAGRVAQDMTAAAARAI